MLKRSAVLMALWEQDLTPLISNLPVGNLIDGKCGVRANGVIKIAVSNPSDDTVLKLPRALETGGSIVSSSAGDVNDAVAAAHIAAQSWKTSSVEDRSKVLKTLATIIRQDAKYLAELDSLSCGLCLKDTLYSMESCAGCFEYFSHLVWSTNGGVNGAGFTQLPPILDSAARPSTRRFPIGVCALITPFNYPLEMGVWKMAPAIAAGNTIVWKPPELAPLSALRFSQLLSEAMITSVVGETKTAIPRGLINIVHGSGEETGQALISHDLVGLVGFTGSVSAGRRVQVGAAQAPTMKRVNLELGGNGFGIVAPDYTDVKKAAECITSACFTNAGQSCTSCRRAIVPRSKLAEFVEAAAEAAAGKKIGHALDEAVDVGPLINEAAVERVLKTVHEATEKGSSGGLQLVCGGFRPDYKSGSYVLPTVVLCDPLENSGEALENPLVKEELFGPVLVVIPYEDMVMEPDAKGDSPTLTPLPVEVALESALKIANNTRYGLSCSVFTDNSKSQEYLTSRVEAGMCWVNGADVMNASTPFGGIKNSGYGKDLGEQSLDSYTWSKTVVVSSQ